jgi:TctA family transporter
VYPLPWNLRVSHEFVMPAIMLRTISAYTTTTRVFTVYMMLGFDVLGMLRRRWGSRWCR